MLNTFQSIGCRHRYFVSLEYGDIQVLNTFQSIGCRHAGAVGITENSSKVLNTFQSIGCRHGYRLSGPKPLPRAEYLSVDRL